MSLLIAALGLTAAVSANRVDAIPVNAADAIRVNGELSEEVWRTAPAVDQFLEREPHEGGEPAQRTEFRVAYDAATLYVKVRAFDSDPDKIITYLTRRDQDSPCDWLYVLIDSYHDRRTAYEFGVNPSGVKRDRYWFNDNNSDDSWDAIWDVSVTRDAAGWAAEFRIPFSQLRFTPGGSSTFGFAVKRQIGRLNETSTWPLLARSANGYVSSFGELGGLTMSSTPKKLELMPYTVADLTRQRPGGNPLVDGTQPGASFGLDAKYALTPGLTLTTTVNPDFGQVEADPAVVNLTAFETFFTERRPFFVEGSGTFNFGMDCNDGACTGLFYSRRIGRAPQGVDDLPSGDRIYTDAPGQTTIVGAGKLTGRVGRYSIGVLQAVTREQTARVWNDGAIGRNPVEPLTSYSIGRVRREFADQSSVGMMITSTNREVPPSLEFLASRANAAGADWDVRFRKRYAMTGYLVGSSIRGGAAAIDRLQENSRHYYQRPDLSSVTLDPARTSLNGSAGQIAIAKIGGEHVRFNSNVGFKTPGFDINDLGFLRRADQRTMSNWLQFRSDRPNRVFRSRMINFNQWRAWNFDGDRLWGGQNVNAHATFVNNWQIGGGYNWGSGGIDDRATRGGPGVFTEGFKEAWWYVRTDNRRSLSLNYEGGGGGDGHGTTWMDVSPTVTYRPVPAIMATMGVRVSRNVFDAQWVENVTDTSEHYVFGHLDQTTLALTGRLNYTMTPTLSLQLYAQPFVSAGDYDRFRELVDPRNAVHDARYAPYAFDLTANDDPNFNVKSFRTTNVLRWEYKPGSTLFVVWQQARENDAVPGGFGFGRDLRGIFGVAPKNVFLVKLAYWLNY
jgi:uncharacterized protein DUF5916/cellulose/xylan binding protein with CBM9 domain